MGHNMVLSYDYAKQKKAAATNECTSIAAHVDGHAEALKRYMRHRPMQHVPGYTRIKCDIIKTLKMSRLKSF